MARRLAEACGAGADVEATGDRRVALDGADYVITCFQVGGLHPATIVDFVVPKRYGVRQTIADTLGIGGIMRGLRTIPVLLDVCRDMEELCPDALLLQYVNPMAMLCWAVAEASPIRTVGLCHSVQHTAAQLAGVLEVEPPEVDFLVAGINHLAFFLTLERGGQDLYPRLRELVEADRVPPEDRVRFEVLRHLGYFVTESSEHFAEYVPWFIKSARPDLIDRYAIPLDEYPRRCDRQIEEWAAMRAGLENGAAVPVERSNEYGADIINACETGVPFGFNGNVPNAAAGGQLIDNLPARVLRGGPVRRRRARDRAPRGGRAAATPRGADPDQRQRPGPDGVGCADRSARARVPRGDARPPHRGRAAARRDRGARRRAAVGPRRSRAPARSMNERDALSGA